MFISANGESGTLSPPEITIKDVTGAGDSLVSGIIYAYLKGLSIEEACKLGMSCSALTLQSHETVNPALTEQHILKAVQKYFN